MAYYGSLTPSRPAPSAAPGPGQNSLYPNYAAYASNRSSLSSYTGPSFVPRPFLQTPHFRQNHAPRIHWTVESSERVMFPSKRTGLLAGFGAESG